MKIVITAGGTGGHIYPALALAMELTNRGHSIIYIGHSQKMEATIVKATPYPFYGINNAGLTPGIISKIKALYSQIGAIRQVKRILKQQEVDMVISFGGYVTFPVCEAARQLKIKYIIHEQNAFAGKANLALQKKASAIIICYENARQQFSNPHTYLLGNPRSSMVKGQTLNPAILSELGLDKDRPIIYFVMGSLGSETVAKVITQMINEYDLDYAQVVISSGVNNYEVYQKNLRKNVILKEQIDQISLLPHCTLVVSRAGATSLAELMAFGVPAILIPSPYVANNHQYFNAKACVDAGAALMLEEKNLDAATLYHTISNTLNDKTQLRVITDNTQQLAFLDANEKIADLIETIAYE